MVCVRNVLAVLAALVSIVLVMPLLILTVPFWIVSSVTRAVAHLMQRKQSPWDTIIEYAPTVGWRVKPNLNLRYITVDDDSCHVITDSQRCVGGTSFSECEIVVFGDSFAFGYGVDTRDSYFNLNRNLRIKAIGAPGYNMVQELLLMREFSCQLAGKFVVWFICLENDLYDNLRPYSHNLHYRAPFVRKVNGGTEWEIVTGHVNPGKWSYPTIKAAYGPMFAKVCTPSALSEYVYSSCSFLLREGQDTCAQVGAQLAVMTIPKKHQLSECGVKKMASELEDTTGFDPDMPDKMFSEMCHEMELPFVAAKRHLNVEDYKEYDWHWTKQGHRRAAQLVADIYDGRKSGKRTCLVIS